MYAQAVQSVRPVESTVGIYYSPEFMVDDIFLPGSTYQELHKTLRNHVFHTARSNPPSRHRSPKRVSLANPQDSSIKPSSEVAGLEQADPEVHSEGSPTPPELTQHQEYIL
jgi:hypothetical protein